MGWLPWASLLSWIPWCVRLSAVHPVMSGSLQPHGLQPTRLLCPWDSPGKTTGEGYHFLLQAIFPTQGSNHCLLHSRWCLYHYATWEALLPVHTF